GWFLGLLVGQSYHRRRSAFGLRRLPSITFSSPGHGERHVTRGSRLWGTKHIQPKTSVKAAPQGRGQITAQNLDTAQFRGAGDCSEGAFTPRTEPTCVVIWQSRTSHVVPEGILGRVSAGCKQLQTMTKMVMAPLNGGFRATVLTTPLWRVSGA